MKSSTSNTEAKLIRAAQKDPAQFAPIYVAHHEAIFRFVYKRMPDVDSTNDITSQVFIKALNNIFKFKPTGAPFRSWLYRIAVNEINMFYRDSKRKRTVNVDTGMLSNLAEEVQEQKGERDQQREQLIEMLRGAEAEDLVLIEMRFFEKMSFREIGLILGITENNAKVKTYRVLDKFKNQVNKK